MELSTRARRRLSTVLALVLAAESVSAVSVAATTVGNPQAHVASAPAVGTPAAPATLTHATSSAVAGPGSVPSFAPHVVERADPPAAAAAKIGKGDPSIRADVPDAVAKPAAKPAPKPAKVAKPDKPAPRRDPKPAPRRDPKPAPKPASYAGTNHVWIPSLGISRSVRWFPCDRTRPPDNYMYRWGCAGANNVYLLGHAWGVMAPLHDAYVSGHLRVGMKAYYAGSDGKVHVYAVKWWKLTRPTTDASWAWAAQSVPSMTLQTCVGANSEWRLMVRLAEVR
jgi:hypothetical protein